ncbi:hypothetical protein A3K87_04235 [Variovorax paradoxus]|uniref:Winged helix-turn-helix domain-containing protein n=1 Tax=Variovorax paradoxus TaxID=34073 RepID=A0AA91DH93_VARPD|nr:helix-turn-helix domain-containing protein [Variovorax paradoxus]OAK55014.1 hypothetical protein A3K87_04235 [Variovorax paradoxus]
MDATKKKAPAVSAAGPSKANQLSHQFSHKSTRTEAQQLRIIEALRSGPKTTDQLRAIGCYQVSARVHALRHRYKYEILTELFDGYAADGYSHARMARYTLVSEPEGAA